MRTKRVDLSQLNPEQKAAFIQLVKDAKTAAPQMKQLEDTARTVLLQWLRSPTWNIVDSPPPDGGEPPQQGWDIGAPEVNYVERPSM